MPLGLPGFGRRVQADDDELDDDYVDEPYRPEKESGPLPPTRMRGREPAEAYAVAAALVVVGVLNLVVTTGKGAPAHPTLWLSYVGIVLAVVLAATTAAFHNRLASPFAAIVSAFFVTTSKAPSSLSVPHLVALVAALAFALSVSLRQRKDQKAFAPTASTGRRRRGEPEPVPSATKRPAQANRRYTPPKAQTPAKGRRR